MTDTEETTTRHSDEGVGSVPCGDMIGDEAWGRGLYT